MPRLHLHHLGTVEDDDRGLLNKYCDEAHTLLSHDWIKAKGSPHGFNQTQLETDLKAIK